VQQKNRRQSQRIKRGLIIFDGNCKKVFRNLASDSVDSIIHLTNLKTVNGYPIGKSAVLTENSSASSLKYS
jgi:hypothetical protein